MPRAAKTRVVAVIERDDFEDEGARLHPPPVVAADPSLVRLPTSKKRPRKKQDIDYAALSSPGIERGNMGVELEDGKQADMPSMDASEGRTSEQDPAQAAAQANSSKEQTTPKLSSETKRFLLYMVFYSVFLMYIYFGITSLSFWVNNALVSRLVQQPYAPRTTYMEVSSPEAWFDWTFDMMLPTMYPNQTYNGEPLTGQDLLFIKGGGGYRVGAVRLRQLRVQAGSCEIAARFEDALSRCNGAFRRGDEEKGNWTLSDDQTIPWQSSSELQTTTFVGSANKLIYPGSGYVVELPDNYTAARQTLTDLFQAGYIDFQTRSIFLEFNLYNPVADTLTVCRMLAEVTPEGAVVPSFEMGTFGVFLGARVLSSELDTLSHKASFDWEHFCVVLLMSVLVLHRTLCMLTSIRTHGLKWLWASVWNIFTFSSVVMFALQFTLYVNVAWTVMNMVDELRAEERSRFMPLFYVATNYQYLNSLIAINVVCIMFQFFEHASFSPSLSRFVTTLGRSASEMVIICIIIGIVVSGFGISFMMVFGHTEADYRDFFESLATLFDTTLGHFELDNLREIAPYLGPFLFISFVLLMVFVVLSMMFAVVNMAFDEVHEAHGGGADDSKGNGKAEADSDSDDPLLRDWKRCKRTVGAYLQRLPCVAAYEKAEKVIEMGQQRVKTAVGSRRPPRGAQAAVEGPKEEKEEANDPLQLALEQRAAKAREEHERLEANVAAAKAMEEDKKERKREKNRLAEQVLNPKVALMTEIASLEEHQRTLIAQLESAIVQARSRKGQ